MKLLIRSLGVFMFLCSTYSCSNLRSFKAKNNGVQKKSVGLTQTNKIQSGAHSGDIIYKAWIRGIEIVRFSNGQVEYSLCAEPPPDVAETKRKNIRLKFRVLNLQLDAVLGGSAENVPLTGRTGYILIERELNHWLCTAKKNLDLDFEQFFELYQMNKKLLRQVANTEAAKSKYHFKVKRLLGEIIGSTNGFNHDHELSVN
jgi:hypothetical protein